MRAIHREVGATVCLTSPSAETKSFLNMETEKIYLFSMYTFNCGSVDFG